MKLNIKKLAVAATLLMSLVSGCDMDKYPLTNFSEDTFYDNAENLQLALTGLYRGDISFGVDYNVSDWWGYTAVILFDGITDIGYDRRGLNNAFAQLTSGALSETNQWVNNLYQRPYKRISACCRFIDGLEKVGAQTSEMKRMEAEARFIRAVQYFYLASYYHDVPLVTKTLTLDEANNVIKAKRADVLKYAADELEAVAAILPRQKDLPSSEIGRATAQAALVYLARTYLVMEDFKNAAKTCDKIIEYGDNTLAEDYQKLFYQSGENESENIFATQFIDDLAGIGLPQHAYPVKDGGWCLVNMTAKLFETYEFTDGTPFSYADPRFDISSLGKNRDPRLDYTFYYDGATFRGTVFHCHPETTAADKIGAGQTTQTGFLLRKYLDESWSGDLNAAGINVPLARYADVLLMDLEAKVRGGETITQELLDKTINAVRGRKSVNMPPITEKDPAKLFKLIQNERVVELAFEGWRLWDLFRWGMAKETLNEDIYGAPFIVSNQDVMKKKDGQTDPYNRWYVNTRSFKDGQDTWPIPLSEKNINPNLR